jgi:hypothetical protein
MSSLPSISHHLFVAAIQEENGSSPKRDASKLLIDLPEPSDPVSMDRTDRALTLPVAVASTTPEARVSQ